MVAINRTATAARVLATVVAAGVASGPALASTYKVIYSFTDGADGQEPAGGVIQDKFGNLYGETIHGGTICPGGSGTNNGRYGCGTLYKVDRTGAFTTLVTFDKTNGSLGKNPLTLIGSTLYGTTFAGGPKNAGVLFSLATDGAHFRVLHHFRGPDGKNPIGALRAGLHGVAYGVTQYGGTAFLGETYGVLFELAPDGTYTILHNFTNGADGAQPNGIIVSPSGVIFGTTTTGGDHVAGCTSNGCGVVYTYDPGTGSFTVLHSFAQTDGDAPVLGSLGADGMLYGATMYGGNTNGYGTLFSLATTGSQLFTTLAVFDGTGGEEPMSGPLLNEDGSLTGTTFYGSTNSDGTLYHYASGVLTTEYSFGVHPRDGANPEAQPVVGGFGELTGTTLYGGPQHNGTFGVIYRVVP